MNARYISDTLPPTTPCVALLNGANPIHLTADDVAKNLSRSLDADRVDLLMVTLEEVESFGSPGELGRCAQLWASDDGEEVTP